MSAKKRNSHQCKKMKRLAYTVLRQRAGNGPYYWTLTNDKIWGILSLLVQSIYFCPYCGIDLKKIYRMKTAKRGRALPKMTDWSPETGC